MVCLRYMTNLSWYWLQAPHDSVLVRNRCLLDSCSSDKTTCSALSHSELSGETLFALCTNHFTRKKSQIYPSNFEPSPCHRFIKAMQDRNKVCKITFLLSSKCFYWYLVAFEGMSLVGLFMSVVWILRLALQDYTQNIDTLEMKAGIDRVLQCHGSFRTASCIHCHTKVPGDAIKDDLMACRVPLCKSCNDAKSLLKLRNPRKKKKKKRNDGWESDEDERKPPLPPGIMKVSHISYELMFEMNLCTCTHEILYISLAGYHLLWRKTFRPIWRKVLQGPQEDGFLAHYWDLPEG